MATPVVTIVNASLGQVNVFIPLAQAELLKPTSTTTPPKMPLPIWDVIISNADQTKVYKIVKGDVTVEAGVTHWT